MELPLRIEEDLGILKKYIKVLSNDHALCLVDSAWLGVLMQQGSIPNPFIQNEELSDESCKQFLSQADSLVPDNWMFIVVQTVLKERGKIPRLIKDSPTSMFDSFDLSYSQLIHYVTETNYRNLWKQSWRKYCCINDDSKQKCKEYQNHDDVVREMIHRLYKCPFLRLSDTCKYSEYIPCQWTSFRNGMTHPNMASVFCAIESNTAFYVIHPKLEHSLHHCVMFSPAIIETSNMCSLFVVYQILQILCALHNHGLFMGALSLSEIIVKQNLWIQIVPCPWKSLKLEEFGFKSLVMDKSSPSQEKDVISINASDSINSGNELPLQKERSIASEKRDILCSLIEGWVKGYINNFDYLMELNKLAGRVLYNPKSHPVMPWIMDFSAPAGGWRDLSKSKFRLNKGDKQLDLMYESAINVTKNNAYGNINNLLQDTATLVPHHTSEVLSDITYYVYKARRLPKTVLCQHVRQKWVPAEYPSTIERLQEWTPDECIPEFFSDATIFHSLHEDLDHLGIPWWCDSPEDFIFKHRMALESDHISERLHHWIDITFGYRLSGNAALKSKNVCLPLVDQHTTISNHGMVQLFTFPHPHKLSSSLYFGSSAPRTFRNVGHKIDNTKDSGDDETSSESSGRTGRWKVLRSKSVPNSTELAKSEPRAENQTIVLPKDYNPLAALKQLESYYTFISQTSGTKYSSKTQSCAKYDCVSIHHHQNKDMLILGCLIGELSIPSHLRAFPHNNTMEERYSLLTQLLRTNKHEIPRCFQKALQLLLQINTSFAPEILPIRNEFTKLPGRYPPVSNSGLPPPSAHQLLQPLIHVIPFPFCFGELYDFLKKLNNYSYQISEVASSDISLQTKQKLLRKLARSKIHFAAEKLQKLLPKLNSEGVDLLIPYIQEMFENSFTSLLATWHLFSIVSQCLGPQQTARKLLGTLKKVFDTDVPSPKHIKLYHRSFLLQLIVRLGLHTFLAHFMTILIEAIGGSKDYLSGNSDSKQANLDSSDLAVMHKASHLHSQEFHLIPKGSDLDSNVDVPGSSPFGDESDGNPHFCSESSIGKEPEVFDFDDMSEESDKTMKEFVQIVDLPHQLADSSEQSNEVEISEESHIDHVVPSFSINEEAIKENLISSVSNLQVQSKTYSCSAPNLSTHLSHWPAEADETENTESRSSVDTLKSSSKDLIISNKTNANLENEYNISDVSSESVIWLAHRLGPVLTARYLTRNLLRMLSLCYDGQEKREFINESQDNFSDVSSLSISQRWIVGDKHASKVLSCLSRIAALYGEQYIMLQYLPHVADLLALCKKCLTTSLEAGLLGAISLLHHIIPYLSDVSLMDHLQDVISRDILYVVIRLVSSLHLTFPGGGHSRFIITCRVIDIIYLIGLRIGFEMTRKHLSSLLQRFFSCFDKVYEKDGNLKSMQEGSITVITNSSPLKHRAMKEMRQTFTPEIAYVSYIPFCKLAGGIHMEHTLKNDELIRHLCLLHDLNLSSNIENEHGSAESGSDCPRNLSYSKAHHRVPSLGQDESFVSGVFGKNVIVVGNRLDVHLGDESHLVTAVGEPVPSVSDQVSTTSKVTNFPKYDINLLKRKMDNGQRHLKGNWLAYWEHESGRSEKDHHFNFKQIKLQSFMGHTGTIRTISVLDNENSFLTSSKDKTVKLWALRSCGDGSTQNPCQWTYTQHRKSVFAVSFMDSLRLVGSCDSTVHIWDPFMGSCIKQLELTKGSPVTVLTSMPAPSTTFLAATTNSTVRFLDARTCRYMHEFKVSVGQTGLVRCLAVSPNGHWLAVGHSTGMISVLDVRTGLLFGTWMGHEGEILQLKAFNNTCFVTSSLDHTLSVWNYQDNQAKCHLKGPLEPVTSLCFYKSEVISGTAANRIGLHTSIDDKATYSSTRLRSDTFKGMLSSMALLPLNRLLLLGSDNGSVVLLS